MINLCLRLKLFTLHRSYLHIIPRLVRGFPPKRFKYAFISTQFEAPSQPAKTINQWGREGNYFDILTRCNLPQLWANYLPHFTFILRSASKLFANIFFFFCIFFLLISFACCAHCARRALCVCTDNWNKDNFETVVKWKLHGMCLLHATDTGTVPVPFSVPVPLQFPSHQTRLHCAQMKMPKKACLVFRFLLAFFVLLLLIYLMPAARRDNNVQKT